MVQQLRTLAALVQDWVLVRSTHLMAHACSQVQSRSSDIVLWPPQVLHRHSELYTSTQNTHT